MIEVRRLELSKKNLKKFTQFQIDLYKGNPCYVPPLISDDVRTLSPSENPAFDFCEVACFMAFSGGKPVGRIATIINRKVNSRENKKDCRFGFLDFTDDPEVSRALFKAAGDWARSRGMETLTGPLGFTDLDHEGLLVEGFDELGTMATIYNYPYYPRHLERLGFKKQADWVEFLMEVPDAVPEKYSRIAEIVRRKFNLRVLKFKSRSEIKKRYARELFELINESYDKLYEYSPLSPRQIDYYIGLYLDLLNLDLVTLIVDDSDKLVGVGISMPSMSRALQKSKGKMFPFGWIPLLKGLKGRNDRVDLMLVAVKPEYQNKGVNALLFTDLIPQYIRYGYKWGESNPELETNSKVQSQWEYFNHRQHRRRRAYSKKL